MNRLFCLPHAWLVVGLTAATLSVQAVDWPRWLGPEGNNQVAAPGFQADVSTWKVAWKASVGHGYSAVAVAGNDAITLGHDGDAKETVFCFDVQSGKERWRHSYEAQLLAKMHPGGPNATATILADRVITLSKDGQVRVLSRADGHKLWELDLAHAPGLKLPMWGFASSPVVDGNRLIFAAGRVIAVDLEKGSVLWSSSGDYHPGYTTAVVFRREGHAYIAALDGKGFTILEGADGKEIVRRPFSAMFDMNGTTPLIVDSGKQIYISGNKSSELLAFDGQTLTPVWTSTELKSPMNAPVIRDGAIYGIDGRQGSPSRLVSIHLADGKVNWAKEGFGFGNTIGVESSLVALNEDGLLVTAALSQDGYKETGRQQVLGKTCWTPPVFAQNRIFVRNDKGDVECLAP
jgi:outer membrane protein assembly factor BamB